MHHRALDEITQIATVQPAVGLSRRAVRRQRLHRLADLLCAYKGPIRLLSLIEYLPTDERHKLRGDLTPLAVAYTDAEFRLSGLAGDTVGDVMPFFGLSDRQVHRLFCNCHYGIAVDASMIATRVRAVADHVSFRERWENVSAYFART